MSDRRALLEAELAAVSAEDELIKAKDKKNMSVEKMREFKLATREARRVYRELRDASTDEDEGTARPAAVGATGKARGKDS